MSNNFMLINVMAKKASRDDVMHKPLEIRRWLKLKLLATLQWETSEFIDPVVEPYK